MAFPIQDVAKQVQDAVYNGLEAMAGLTVAGGEHPRGRHPLCQGAEAAAGSEVNKEDRAGTNSGAVFCSGEKGGFCRRGRGRFAGIFDKWLGQEKSIFSHTK
ncbi:MAG: hypothetical protein ACOX0U_04720 [Oscillospiraceae bacterium]